VDIQIQKDINSKISASHTSTDDVQIEIMQKMKEQDDTVNSSVVNIPKDASDIHSSEEKIIVSAPDNELEKNDTVVTEYQKVIEEIIPEETMSIYSEKVEANDSETEKITHSDERKQNTPTLFNNTSPPQKINFKINDKFRIIRKLFNNQSDKFNEFVNTLNTFSTLSDAQNYIRSASQEYQWDEECLEYKILVQQNQTRFKS
ncbi:MAG: hypothetical protein D6799_05145, partial [Bacteroidetes bacterium]